MPNLRSFLHFPQRLDFSKAVCTEDLVKIFKSLVATLATLCCRGDAGGDQASRGLAVVIAHARIEEKFNFIIVTRFFIQSDCEFEF